jgi:RNA polymerase sigma factor (sigma-70 family)
MSVQANCERAVALLGPELDLSSAQMAAYAETITAYVPARYNDSQLLRLVRYYHLDHEEVEALRDARHPGHEEAWAKWLPQALRILRDRNFGWLTNGALDIEDLGQIALKELHASLSTYRFNSRFSTWAYIVIVRAVQNAIRQQHAAKRNGASISIDEREALMQLGPDDDDPVIVGQAAALTADIYRILAEPGGSRWVESFQRWVLADERLIDIGQRIKLSPARLSILLDQMRTLLQQHPDIVEWYRPQRSESAAGSEDEEKLDYTDMPENLS